MVLDSISSLSYGRSFTLWQHLHRNVFRFHIVLELQGINLFTTWEFNYKDQEKVSFLMAFLVSCQVYYVYGFMLLVFLILVVVTVCVTIVGTYFLLNAENYHWQWTSFFSAASTAVYVYLYSIYYYYVKTKMFGFFQTSFYFGYTLMFCLGLGILCGWCFFFTLPSQLQN